MKTTKVLIADDHTVVRQGVAALLGREKDMEVIGQAIDGQKVMEKLEGGDPPDLVILDINMPRKNGMIVAAEIKARHPQVKVLILSMHNRSEFINKLREINVDGYVLKNSGDELIEAVRTIARGGTYFCKGVRETLFDQSGANSHQSLLTEREKQVLGLIAKGYSSQEAADELNLTKHTVNSHRKKILTKLHLKNSSEMTIYALRTGIIKGFDIE